MEHTAAVTDQDTAERAVQGDTASTVSHSQQSQNIRVPAGGNGVDVADLLQQQVQHEQQLTVEAAGMYPPYQDQLQHLQQQQLPHPWMSAWQDQGLNSSGGSGGSLGTLNQLGSELTPADVQREVLTSSTASRAWHTSHMLPASARASPLDVLGRQGQARLQGLARQQIPGEVLAHPSSMLPDPLSLPASPTMVQHQWQQQTQLLQQQQPGSFPHDTSPNSPSWPDVDTEQPPVQPSAGASNGDNGEPLLWHGGPFVPTSSTHPLLQQPDVPLGLQLQSAAQAVSQQQQQQLRQQQAVDISSTSQQQLVHQQQQISTAAMSAPSTPWFSNSQNTPRQLLPPPLPPSTGEAAALLNAAATAGGAPGPRPPPLVIPSTQQQQTQQQSTQIQQHLTLAPTPSPAAPVSGTSVTPAMLSMALTDTPRADNSVLPGISEQEGGSGASRFRRPRRRASVPSSPTVPGSTHPHSAAPTAMVGAAALLRAGRRNFQVVCGNLTGWLDVSSMMVQVQGVGQDSRVTPAAFEALAGKGSTRKWRQSLTVLPLNANDQFVTEPITLGDFMKQYYLDRPSSAASHSGRASSSSIGGWEDNLVSPGRISSLVSPGARRRRQLQSSSQESAEAATTDTAEEGDQPHMYAKRSRGAAGEPAAQERPPQLPPQMQTWQHLQVPKWPKYTPDAAGAAAGETMLTGALVQQQPHFTQPADIWHAAAAGQGAAEQQLGIPRSLSAQSLQSQSPLQPLPHEHLQQQVPRLTEPHMQPRTAPGQTQWQTHRPPLLANRSESPADAAAATRTVTTVASQAEQPARLQPVTSKQGDTQQQRRRRQQHAAAAAQQPSAEARGPQELQSTALTADAPSRVSGGQLVSSSGRPIRQPVTSKSAFAAAAAARYERGSQPVGYKGGVRQLEVWCDQLRGVLDLHKMQVVPQEGECEGQPMSLSAFEQLGGRGTARKWRRSLTTLDGTELVSLGEWFERYQVLPGTQYAANVKTQARAGSRPRGSTPPDVRTGLLHGAHATSAGRQTRDQQATKDPQQRHAAAPVHPGALNTAAAAGQTEQQPQHRLHEHVSTHEAPLAQVQYPRGGFLQFQCDLQMEATDNKAETPESHQLRDVFVPSAASDIRRPSLDTRHTGTAPAANPELAAPTAADEQINSEFLMMMTEYASDYHHPELELLPAQVEQDMADLSALPAGAHGVLSPRLADWQQQQLLGTAGTAPPARHAAATMFEPPPGTMSGVSEQRKSLADEGGDVNMQ